MIASLLLALLITVSGTVATYLYDEDAPIAARLCAGGVLGLAALGLVSFVVASFIGLNGAAVVFSTAICCSPLALLIDPETQKHLREDLERAWNTTRNGFLRPELKLVGYFLFYAFVTIVLWRVFSRAVIENQNGLSTGLLNNFGDLPFHISVITSFALGNNFPPEDPTYAGVFFTYPFISDFVSAVFVRCGANLRQSMFIENFILGIAFVGLLHRWALVMLRESLAAIITPLLVLLNGGFGFKMLFDKALENKGGLFGVLTDLPPSFTVIPETTWRWGNAISALLVPQRGFLMGLPLATIAFTQWWLATTKEQRQVVEKSKKRTAPIPETTTRFPIATRRMIAAGVAAGLLPLVHAHSFIVVMAMAGCLALIRRQWRDWFAFFAVASAIAIPQLLWSTMNSAVDASTFFAFETGWDHGKDTPIWFWIKNTGLFIPLIFVAILLKSDGFVVPRGELVSYLRKYDGYVVPRQVLLFYLPFTLCFIIPNFVKMAPWIWDNIKVLYYWWLASAPIVALLLAKLWHAGSIRRVIAVVLFGIVTLSGALDVAGIALRRGNEYQIFSADGIRFAEVVKEQTQPRSLVIQAPVHNTPVFLTGRRSLMGYPGHIWTHGLEFVQRESEVRRIYQGSVDADQLLRKYGVEYAVVGPQERMVTAVNEAFFSKFQQVGEVGDYKLYKIR